MSGIEAIIVPVVIAITGTVKAYGADSRLLPIVAIIIGGAFGFALQQDVMGVAEGIVAGLSAMGIYSGSKTLAKK